MNHLSLAHLALDDEEVCDEIGAPEDWSEPQAGSFYS